MHVLRQSGAKNGVASGAKPGARRPIWSVVLPYLPMATLLGYWLFGETGLIVTAVGLPMMVSLVSVFRAPERPLIASQDGLPSRSQLIGRLDDWFLSGIPPGSDFACMVVQFDNAATLLDRHGRAAQTEVLLRSGERLISVLRPADQITRLEAGGFALVLGPRRRLDLDALVQCAARLQAAVAEPVPLGATRVFVTASVGFCLGSCAPAASGAALLDAAQIAADDAIRHGPGAIRAFSQHMARKHADRDARRAELESALDDGQIQAYFQPQISADTGQVSGFETLARWMHPTRGVIAPDAFLGSMNDAGLSERLSEVMLHHALVALSRWDKAGVHVPTAGVNFSNDELRNPRLADRLKWELDRFDLPAHRLCIEILETVISSSDSDVIVRNIAELARMGCRIDLDDFGTGHTSINNIRRFRVHRLKIDRSFIAGLDREVEQKRVVSAILSLADRLGIDTLAEGVETTGEHLALAQLGCGHLQGYGIARPMPFDQTIDWVKTHESRRQEQLRNSPRFG